MKYIDANGTLRLDEAEYLFYFALGHLAMGMTEQATKHVERLRSIAPPLAQELQATWTVRTDENTHRRSSEKTWEQVNPNSPTQYIAPTYARCVTSRRTAMIGKPPESTWPCQSQSNSNCSAKYSQSGIREICLAKSWIEFPRITECPSDPDDQGA